MTLPPAKIISFGAVTPFGRDPQAIAQKLAEPAPAFSPTFNVPDEILEDPATARQLRRADRFVRMASIAALDAWTRAKIDTPSERVGLIVTSGLGPHCRGFKFLDGILDCGDAEALPTDFSHSVHGAAASYIAGLLDLRGPSLTTTDFQLGFEHAVQLAQCWLDQKTCDRILLGAVEELGQVLIDCAARMLPPDRPIPLGEGAVFFTLAPTDSQGIANIDASSIDASRISANVPPAFASYFGQSASTTAFEALGHLLTNRPPTFTATFATGLRLAIGK